MTLTADEEKLFALARSARARVAADCGAAVIDETGRTYSGAAVVLPHLTLTALQLAIAQAASAGADHLTGAVLVGAAAPADVAVFADLAGPGALLLHCGSDRSVLQRWAAS